MLFRSTLRFRLIGELDSALGADKALLELDRVQIHDWVNFVELPVLPRNIDAATTAVYIQSVISGEKPAPGPLARQAECIAEAWRALTGERMRERSA